jgi:hypothetical protein
MTAEYMDILTIIIALCISTAALAYLAQTDPKRRRVSNHPPYEKPRRVWLSLFILSVPGIWLLMSGNGAGFTIWLGGLTVAGWGVAAINPTRAEAWWETALACMNKTGRIVILGWSGLVSTTQRVRAGIVFLQGGIDRIAVLEVRIDQLESEIQRLKHMQQHLQAIDSGTDGRNISKVQERLSGREAVGQ